MKPQLCKVRSRSFIGAILSAACLFLGCANGFGDHEYTNWDRDVVESATGQNIPVMPFYVGVTTSIDGRLFALCGYKYVKGTKTVTLRGRRDSDGNFWPAVSYEVATIGKTKWRIISKSNLPGDPDTASISSDVGKTPLYVDMEPFKALIGDTRWGRIVLENGDAAIFALEDLLPPGDRRGAGRDFNDVVDDRLQTQFGSSAILHSVSSARDHLNGVFVYTRSPSPTTLEGATTLDADFWPSVTLYAGNSDKDWHPIGVSRHEGSPASIQCSEKGSPAVLRVSLDAYKSEIGRHEYGKIVFSDGSFAVFLISNLNPKS